MSENQTQDQVNEFGSKISPNADANVALNENGPDQGTLAQILAAIRGKDVETQPAKVPATEDKGNLGVDDAVEKPLPTADDEDFKFETGNKALDVAVSSFLRSTGASDADIERACKSALEYGDPKLIDRAFIAEKFGDRAADAVALAEAVIEQAGVEKQRTVQAVYDLAGSKEQWDTALGVYKQHAPAGLQKALGIMFSSGDAASVKEAAGLVLEFAKGSGVLPVGAGQRQVAGGGTAASEGLSAQEFKAALSKLNPNARSYHQDYERLLNMRRVGKQLGM